LGRPWRRASRTVSPRWGCWDTGRPAGRGSEGAGPKKPTRCAMRCARACRWRARSAPCRGSGSTRRMRCLGPGAGGRRRE
jgi:hypothetical protein